jgi:hypothetical protein
MAAAAVLQICHLANTACAEFAFSGRDVRTRRCSLRRRCQISPQSVRFVYACCCGRLNVLWLFAESKGEHSSSAFRVHSACQVPSCLTRLWAAGQQQPQQPSQQQQQPAVEPVQLSIAVVKQFDLRRELAQAAEDAVPEAYQPSVCISNVREYFVQCR